jgi:hypothetical protein
VVLDVLLLGGRSFKVVLDIDNYVSDLKLKIEKEQGVLYGLQELFSLNSIRGMDLELSDGDTIRGIKNVLLLQRLDTGLDLERTFPLLPIPNYWHVSISQFGAGARHVWSHVEFFI